MNPTPHIPLMERARYILYGLAAGLFAGIFLGWMFHGFVGLLVRLIVIIAILTPFVLAVIFWMKVTNRNREERSAIQEAEWRDASGPR